MLLLFSERQMQPSSEQKGFQYSNRNICTKSDGTVISLGITCRTIHFQEHQCVTKLGLQQGACELELEEIAFSQAIDICAEVNFTYPSTTHSLLLKPRTQSTRNGKRWRK